MKLEEVNKILKSFDIEELKSDLSNITSIIELIRKEIHKIEKQEARDYLVLKQNIEIDNRNKTDLLHITLRYLVMIAKETN